jgi:uncharacterized protein GlcG (DUF336 family)
MLIRGVMTLFAAGVGLTAASGASAQLIDHKDLSLATALAIATGAAEHCKAQKFTVSVTVVGREAQILVQLRGDGSPPHTIENSYRRAYTALTYRKPTVDVEKEVRADPLDPLVHLTHVMPAQGGLPIKVNGDTIGAVAVSGSPAGQTDQGCAQAGLDKVADQLK